MPICPYCETKVASVYAPCPTGDGYYSIDEKRFAAFRGDPMLGVLLGGRFVVDAVIGHGAIGRVYRGFQLGIERDVVLKIFTLENIVDEQHGYSPTRTVAQMREDAQNRFVREAKVLGQLTHPNCVTVYDFGVEQDRALLYIAMELVAGISMRQAIARGLKPDATFSIMEQIFQAVRQAHALGIVHRDLKPENILLTFRPETREPVVKVLDFGIAKLVGREETTAGLLFGTPAYMSPEQCRGASDEVGPASDIYSLGCLFFELVTGQLPYPGTSPQQMIMMHQERTAPPITPRDGMVLPDGMEAFIHKCMNKAPRDRFADAAQALKILGEVLDEFRRSQGAQIFASSTELEALKRSEVMAKAARAVDVMDRAAQPAQRMLDTDVKPHASNAHTVVSTKHSTPNTGPSRELSMVVAIALGVLMLFCAFVFVVLYTLL